MTNIQYAIVEFPCVHCDRMVRLQGGQVVICCDVAYSLEFVLKTELDRDRIARIYELNQALGLMGVPASPMEHSDGL